MGNNYMTVKELSQKTGVPEATLKLWIRNGLIKAARSGLSPRGPFVIPMDEARRVIDRLKNPAPV